MVLSLCRETSDPTGVTHCAAAYWTRARDEADVPDVIVAKTTQLEVYSLDEYGAGDGVLELQATHKLFGEVQGMAALQSRVHGTRDALVIAFGEVRWWRSRALAGMRNVSAALARFLRPHAHPPARGGSPALTRPLTTPQGRVAVLAWDAAALCVVSSSLHCFDASQLPTGGRTLFPRPELVRADPSGRCGAVLLLRSVLAVLPAVDARPAQGGIGCVDGAAAVGNSFVIDLVDMGIRCVRDFAFLHK